MSNSFYYFFSAVPQVLGGILALFGVFVIFKIQGLKKQLIGIGRSLINVVEDIYQEDVRLHNDHRMTSLTGITATVIRESVLREDTYEINALLKKITIVVSEFKEEFEIYKRLYLSVYEGIQSLVKRTIFWSVFTAAIIIFCLASIPFACLILKFPYLLYIIFFAVIVSIGLSFCGLISILKRALNDSDIELKIK
jgi:hypothetical protein